MLGRRGGTAVLRQIGRWRLLRGGKILLGLLELLAVLAKCPLGLCELLLELHDLLLGAVLALVDRPLEFGDAVLEAAVLVADRRDLRSPVALGRRGGLTRA